MSNQQRTDQLSQVVFLYQLLLAALIVVGAVHASASAEPPDRKLDTDDATLSRRGEEALQPFTKLMGGEWRLTMQSGHMMFERWEWGPGRRSVISQTYGADGGGNPWRSLEVIYWHPQEKKLCTLGLSPDIPGLGRGVSEGALSFDGTIAEGEFDLHQPGHPGRAIRKMMSRWKLEDADTLRRTLLEDDGSGMKPLGEWTHRRVRELSTLPTVDPQADVPAAELAAFRRFIKGTWQAVDTTHQNQARRTSTKLTWIPYLKAIHARTVANADTAQERVLLDAFLYFHVGLKKLRCFALVHDGAVIEGELSLASKKHRLMGTLIEYGNHSSRRLAVEIDWVKFPNVRERFWETKADGSREMIRDIQHQPTLR